MQKPEPQPEKIITRAQLHDIRASLGAIAMASEAVAAEIPVTSQRFFKMIEAHTQKCLELLSD